MKLRQEDLERRDKTRVESMELVNVQRKQVSLDKRKAKEMKILQAKEQADFQI